MNPRPSDFNLMASAFSTIGFSLAFTGPQDWQPLASGGPQPSCSRTTTCSVSHQTSSRACTSSLSDGPQLCLQSPATEPIAFTNIFSQSCFVLTWRNHDRKVQKEEMSRFLQSGLEMAGNEIWDRYHEKSWDCVVLRDKSKVWPL